MSDKDTELMIAFKYGDVSAFEQILKKYKKFVINVAYRYIHNASYAEDISQEVFLRIYNSAQRYTQDAKLSTWIYRITANYCLNEVRAKKKVEQNFKEVIYQNTNSDDNDVLNNMEKKNKSNLVKKALESLPERQRMAVILSKYDGLSYREIAEIIDCTPSAVDSLLQRAKQNLKDKLAGFIDD